MGREYARVMRTRGILAPTEEWTRRDTITDERLWEERHVSEIDERIAQRRSEVLTASWPFRSGITVVSGVPKSDTLALIADQVTRGTLFWHQAHEDAARLYELRGDRRNLEREYRILVSQLPYVNVQPYLRLARLLLDQDRIPEVQQWLAASIDVQPTILAYRALADIALNMRDYSQAITYYEKTFVFAQSKEEQAENGYLLALALLRANRVEEARARLLKVLSVKPDHQASVALLGAMNSRQQ
jgi:tetratricopeptide (TPR) repeat protein